MSKGYAEGSALEERLAEFERSKRERLEAAVANDDPAEARRCLVQFEFSEAQRRHVEALLDAWERERAEG